MPLWFQSIVHVPIVTNVTEVPDTVQIDGVADVAVTANSEVLLAEIATGVVLKAVVGTVAAVIVCDACAIVTVAVTCGAAL